jgi:mRNA-degrading endonuclease RelE of RelBE toxin-antitoxin system
VSYPIRLFEHARADARRIDAFHMRAILSQAETHLTYEPLRETRATKPIRLERVPFEMRNLIRVIVMTEAGSDIWELRVGRWRVLYAVVADPAVVLILRIFEKPDHLDFMTALRQWDGLD